MNSEDKIRVFISSKCGGERINFDKSIKIDSKSKQDVADNAVRTNYDLVRRALRVALEETGLIKTYVFEEGSASTLPVQADYFDELDKSDICLFLIDNFDEKISPGLLAEITRAQKQNKKSIYLFLNQPDRDLTNIQQNLFGISGVRFVPIYDIRDFISVGYKSVINDILKIYQLYCRDNLKLSEQPTLSVEITQQSFPTEIKDIDKQVFKNLGLTKSKLVSLAHIPDEENIQSSDLDKVCLDVLQALLREKEFKDINLASLLETLNRIQPPKLHEMVRQRWDTIAKYYNADIVNAITIMESIYAKYSQDAHIPQWLLNNILVDWANLNTIINESNNTFDWSAQEKISQQETLIFFPLIDRFSADIHNDIWDRNFNIATSSPYTTTYYNLDSLYASIANYLLTAIYYGSHTHLVLALKQVQKVLFDLVQRENNLLNKIQLMRISVLLGDEKSFSKIMDKHKSALSHSTTMEILDLYHLSNTKPLPYQKALWKVILFKELGYYFSDDDYEAISQEIVDISRHWTQEDSLNIILVNKLIDALKLNTDRLSAEKIVSFATTVFNKKYYRFFDSIFDLLKKLDISLLPQDLVSGLLPQLEGLLGDEKIKQDNPSLRKLFIKIRKSRDDFGTQIDEIVEKYDPEFYIEEYHLEVHQGERIIHIQKYIDSIKARNKVQGKDGLFIGFADNPYTTIKNIIDFDNISLPKEMLSNLLQEIANTLFTETQTYSDKINSLVLLMFLKQQRFSHDYDWSTYYSNIKQNVEKTQKGYAGFFEQDDTLLLRLYLVLLQITFNDDPLQDMLEILALINNSSNQEIIGSLIALKDFLQFEKHKLREAPLISVIVQYISSFCFHEDYNIRYHTVQALYQLIDSPYASFVVSRLAKMIDDDDFRVKLAIIKQVELIRKHSMNSFNYIVGKAKIDNNFLVRKVAEKYI